MSQNIGQGSFEFEPNQSAAQSSPEVLDIDLTKRFATSALIKCIAEQRQLEADKVNPEFMDYINSATIEAGLYVPNGKTDRDIATALGPVIFPPNEYSILTKSPVHIANTAATGVLNARDNQDDKDLVNKTAKRASGHALQSQIKRTNLLLSELAGKQEALEVIKNEIFSAKGTGYFAHYKAEKMLPLIGLAELAMFDALNVAATTGGWDEQQYRSAKTALSYQLFGDFEKRYSYWKQYTPVVYRYTRKRKLVVKGTEDQLKRELRKYQPYLDEALDDSQQDAE